eukprot:9478295-Pyramimonas_sp.AAC.1
MGRSSSERSRLSPSMLTWLGRRSGGWGTGLGMGSMSGLPGLPGHMETVKTRDVTGSVVGTQTELQAKVWQLAMRNCDKKASSDGQVSAPLWCARDPQRINARPDAHTLHESTLRDLVSFCVHCATRVLGLKTLKQARTSEARGGTTSPPQDETGFVFGRNVLTLSVARPYERRNDASRFRIKGEGFGVRRHPREVPTSAAGATPGFVKGGHGALEIGSHGLGAAEVLEGALILERHLEAMRGVVRPEFPVEPLAVLLLHLRE